MSFPPSKRLRFSTWLRGLLACSFTACCIIAQGRPIFRPVGYGVLMTVLLMVTHFFILEYAPFRIVIEKLSRVTKIILLVSVLLISSYAFIFSFLLRDIGVVQTSGQKLFLAEIGPIAFVHYVIYWLLSRPRDKTF